MLKELRRWHFDLAIFTGLALFAWAYWYSIPRPSWQVPLIDTVRYEMRLSQLIGQVAWNDQTSCYVECFDTVTKEVHRYIERRSLTQGELLQQIDVQLPIEVNGETQFKLAGATHPEMLVFSTLQTPSAETYLTCFVSSKDGKPVGPVIETKFNESLVVLDRAKDQQDLWALRYSFTFPGTANKSQNPSPDVLINLSSGKVIKELAASDMKPKYAALTLDGNYLLLFRAQKDRFLIELYNTRDWTVQYTSQPIQGYLSYQVQFLPDNTIILNNYIKTNPANSTLQQQFSCYRINPKSQVLVELTHHPLHGLTFKQGTFIVPPHLVEVTHQENKPFTSPFLATLENFFSVVGIRRDYSQKKSITISDLDSHKPLRRIEGLSNDGFQHAPDWQKLIMLSSDMRDNTLINYTLSAYPIHSVEWATTLQWTQYLAWVLVIPWPMRYLVKRNSRTAVH